ncbi:tetratricopeptide repeat protein [Peptoniphilus catoniae]|uniref:tetratricopeptide repeat protein n=1 Tax=Peptoniphilus catoniae TaxID=1660341 RepID=UPI0010FD51A0|nr:hypothetical protein [Peptoniphilus catoniae]
MNLDKEINSRLKNIVFIQLKKDINLESIKLDKEIPLPLILNKLIDDIKEEDLKNKLEINRINEGIIYLLGIDKQFKYKDQYIQIVKATVKNIDLYIDYLSTKADDPINSYIYINSYNNFMDENEDFEFKKYNILETIYNKIYTDISEDEQKSFLNMIIKGYESIIKTDPDYILVNYRLGYIFRLMNRYLKSKLYFEKFLNLSSGKYIELEDEVRDNLKELEDYVNIEAASSYLTYGKYESAYKSLKSISSLYPLKDQVHYLKSIAEEKLGLLESALISIDKSLSINKNEENYYNQKALCYLELKENNKAIETYKEGLEILKESYLLNTNLGILLYNEGNFEYKKYLEKSYKIKADENILNILKK